MAVVLVSESAVCRWAANSLASPTELYYYPNVDDSEGENAYGIGRREKDGTLTDGEITNWFQGLGGSNHAVDLNSAVIEIDDDAASPFKGKLRLVFTVGASVA
jgi:hypothetical protein